MITQLMDTIRVMNSKYFLYFISSTLFASQVFAQYYTQYPTQYQYQQYPTQAQYGYSNPSYAYANAGIYANTGANNLWGTGYYSGQQNCGYQNQTQPGNRGGSNSGRAGGRNGEQSKTSRLQSQLKSKQTERKRAESKSDLLRKRIERYFDASVVDFLLDTHIEGNELCDRYKTSQPQCISGEAMATVSVPVDVGTGGAPDFGSGPPPQGGGPEGSRSVERRQPRRPPSGDASLAAGPAVARTQQVQCSTLIDVPDLLKDKWSGPNGYCVGSGRANAGSVKPSVCSDSSLRSQERRSVNVSECSKALSDYRKNRISLANAADAEERLQDEIDDARYAGRDEDINGDAERSPRDTEAGCEECERQSRGYSYQSNQRDWTSTIANIAGGIGLLWYGKQAEKAANEYNAQAGWPSTQSYGYPYYQAGIYGIINGLTGQGSFGCSSMVGGNSSAFSYPQSYYAGNNSIYGNASLYANYSTNPAAYYGGYNYSYGNSSIYSSQYQAFMQNVQNINAGYTGSSIYSNGVYNPYQYNGLYNTYQYNTLSTVPTTTTSGR